MFVALLCFIYLILCMCYAVLVPIAHPSARSTQHTHTHCCCCCCCLRSVNLQPFQQAIMQSLQQQYRHLQPQHRAARTVRHMVHCSFSFANSERANRPTGRRNRYQEKKHGEGAHALGTVPCCQQCVGGGLRGHHPGLNSNLPLLQNKSCAPSPKGCATSAASSCRPCPTC